MKVRMRKSFLNLPEREKEIINRALTEEVVKHVVHEEAELQKLWLQFACIVLNKNFEFDREQLMLFLGNWKEMYRIIKRIDSKAEQTEYLTTELTRIFGENGYPTAYVDKLENL